MSTPSHPRWLFLEVLYLFRSAFMFRPETTAKIEEAFRLHGVAKEADLKEDDDKLALIRATETHDTSLQAQSDTNRAAADASKVALDAIIEDLKVPDPTSPTTPTA